jgi:hypothetical protein
MAGITTYLSILTLNVYGFNFPIKRWRIEFKSKTQPFVAYKKPILLTKTNIDLGWKGRKRFSKLMNAENRQE